MKQKKESNHSKHMTQNVLLKKVKNPKDLLYLFSMYIALNPDFKYNYTYLTDSIDIFFEDYLNFKAKKEVFMEIINYIKAMTKKDYDIVIIFDSTFRYSILESTDIEVVSENDNYRFDHMGDKSFIVNFQINKPKQIEYVFEIEKYDNIDEKKTKIDIFLKVIFKNKKLKLVVF